jgi:uncharacterized membrane-anchored protein
MRSAVALIACACMLGLVNWSVAQKERLLDGGRIVLVELAPLDPRSLMQGDYMALQFGIANDTRAALMKARSEVDSQAQSTLAAADGRIVARLDANGVATYARQDDAKPLSENEVYLRYRVRQREIRFATNAYFFEEGTAKRYEAAQYGELRVAPDGELLLTGLRGKDFKPLD